MKLNRFNTFLFLAAFLIIVDLLVGLNINAFYIRAVLAFLFITIVPGLLIMLIMKIREVGFWEYLVYTIGLSISFIMFGGLAVNWILPWLNITDKPLSLWPILISFNIFLLIMGFFAYRRNKDLSFEPKFPKLDLINNIFFIIPMFFPIMAILGAFILNNNGPNTLTMIMLGSIAVYVFALVLFRNRLNENVYPWALWMIGLSLLLMFSMRSWYISGWDIAQENKVFKLALDNNIWDLSLFIDAYNACISLSILPTIYNYFINSNEQFIFKLIIQIIFSIIPIIIYEIFNKYLKKEVVFISVFLFISNAMFFLEMPTLIRQEIAILFFTITISVILNKFINSNKKNIIIIIFLCSMIISHYSTSYIALAIFYFAFSLNKTITLKQKKEPRHEDIIKFEILLIVSLFCFLWFSQLTNASGGLTNTLKESIINIGNIFDEDLRDRDSSVFDQLSLKKENPPLATIFNNYTVQKEIEYNDTKNKIVENKEEVVSGLYNTRLVGTKRINPRISQGLSEKILLIQNIIKVLVKFLIILGIFTLIMKKSIRDKFDKRYIYLLYGVALILFAMIVLPILSLRYPLGRLYMQSLIIACIAPTIPLLLFTKKIKINLELAIIIFIIFFLFTTGFVTQIFGGQRLEPSMNLNNLGEVFNQIYVHKSEVLSIGWLDKYGNNKEKIYADIYSKRKLVSFGVNRNIKIGLLPRLIEKDAYVYSDFPNKIEKRASENYKGILLNYNYPTNFLNDKKDKIYNNRESEIFK